MPEVPAVSGSGALSALVEAAFAPGGSLARTLPGFEPRAGQVEMAGAVARTFERGGVLLAEAGTGTGKTLAYLIPAILSRERVLVSTGTKNLQEQIYFKDIPALGRALDVPFTAACMKGRANYLCLHRLHQLTGGAGGPAAHDVFLPMIRDWSACTETGDRAELDDLPEDLPFWNEVSAAADTCLGGECPQYDECFVTRMRQRAAAADVVIVNHHLLCADAALRQNAYGEVIPACRFAVVDEAHQLEDVATQYFGVSVSTYRVEDLAADVERFAGLPSAGGPGDRARLGMAVEALRDGSRAFFAALADSHRSTGRRGDERVRATRESVAAAAGAAADLGLALERVEAALQPIRKRQAEAADGIRPGQDGAGHLAAAHRERGARGTSCGETAPQPGPRSGGDQDGDADEDIASLARRAATLRDELRFLTRTADGRFVYFVEHRGRSGVFFRASPIDVSQIVRELLLERMQSTVLTSATLTVEGSFDYVRQRLGIGPADQVRLASEFDYREQAILYLPPRMPDPRSDEFPLAAGRQVVEILERTEGRAFVLFTSYATLRAVQAIAEMALEYPILAQGTAPRTQLLRQFRETAHAILFATSSFWQGVDVVGEALSCVIVDKLPFASPADPITAARMDAIRDRGGDPFAEYQLPLAILALQQGLGRLIRHRRDRGVLAVLDPRLRTKGYGRRFIASLPPAPIVHDPAHIDRFLGRPA
ncbi:MAG: ATP-dependent DNA helicase [Acidobacteria bacterium]|nr:ATP-dependent DNA helicase [Acidobacteriota bacterium]